MKSERIDQLLDVWMSDRDRGVMRTATELCAESPELESELSRRIEVIGRFEKLANGDNQETLVSQREIDTSDSTNEPIPASLRKPTPMPASIGGFIPVEILGEGGMGAVYLSEDRQLGRRVAVKVMKKELAADPDARRRFLREARAMATIEHDNIMTIYAVGEDQDIPFLVMPVLKGETLDDRLRRDAKLSVAESCRISREIADGLAAAHAHGLIHRDIKPSNIWLEGKQGRVRILDFGLARPATEDQRVTQSGAVLGTPAYMAPEQAAGTDATPRSDLFSLGAVMYRMTTGEQPFAGPNMMATLNNLANKHPEPPRQNHPEIPEVLSMLIQRLISKSPDQRPESASAVLDALQQTSETQTPQATIATPLAVRNSVQPEAVHQTVAKPQVEPTSGSRPPGIPRRLIAGAFGGFLLFLAVVVYRIQTDHGTLIVTIDDDQVEARLSKEGLVIEDAKTGRTWKLTPDKSETMPSGDYKLPRLDGLLLSVSDDSGTEFTTTEFRIKRGDTTTVLVTLESNTRVSAAGRVTANSPATPTMDHVSGKGVGDVAVSPSPLDALDASQIPADLRDEAMPKETVAVFNSYEQKTWRSPFFASHGNLTYSSDGKWICACDFSNVYLFDAATLKLRKRYSDVIYASKSHRPAAFDPQSTELLIGLQSQKSGVSILVTDLTSPELKTRSMPDVRPVPLLAFSPDGRQLAMAENGVPEQLTVAKRDPVTNAISEPELVPDLPDSSPNSEAGGARELAFSPDGKWLIEGRNPFNYRVFYQQDEKFIPVAVISCSTPINNTRVVYSFTKDHKRALLLGLDACHLLDLSLLDDLPPDLPVPSVAVQELETPKELNSVADITISADGLTWAASKYNPGTASQLLLGNWVDGRPAVTQTIDLSGTGPGQVALSSDAGSLAVMADNLFLRVFDLTQNPPVERTSTPMAGTAVASSGNTALTVAWDGTLQLQSLEGGQIRILDTLKIEQPLMSVDLSADGKRAVTRTRPDFHSPLGSRVQTWNIDEGKLKELSRFDGTEVRMWASCRLAAKGDRVLYGNQMWDISTATPTVLAEFSAIPPSPIDALAGDGRTVAFASRDGQLSVYEVSRPDLPLATLQLAPDLSMDTQSLAFNSDGSRLVVSAAGGQCAVLDIKDGQLTEAIRMPVSSWEMPPYYVPYHMSSAVFSKDGHRVYFAGWGCLGEWDLDENKVTRSWPLPGQSSLSLADDGRHLVMNNSNGTTWILRLPTP